MSAPPAKPLFEADDDFDKAVMDVALEMDARQSRRDRWWDAARSVFLLLAIIRYTPWWRR